MAPRLAILREHPLSKPRVPTCINYIIHLRFWDCQNGASPTNQMLKSVARIALVGQGTLAHRICPSEPACSPLPGDRVNRWPQKAASPCEGTDWDLYLPCWPRPHQPFCHIWDQGLPAACLMICEMPRWRSRGSSQCYRKRCILSPREGSSCATTCLSCCRNYGIGIRRGALSRHLGVGCVDFPGDVEEPLQREVEPEERLGMILVGCLD